MIEISRETEARIREEARRQGVSVDALLERLLSEYAAEHIAGGGAVPRLARLHFG